MFYEFGNVVDYNLTMIRGDTLSFGIEFEGLDQELETAYFTCKRSYDDTTPLFEKSIGAGIHHLEDNYYGVRIAPEDTANLEAGKYYYDLEISVNGDVFTVMRGYLELKPDATHGRSHGNQTDDTDFSITLIMEGANVSVVDETLIIEEVE